MLPSASPLKSLRSARPLLVGVLAGACLVYLSIKTAPTNALWYALLGVAFAGLVAGWFARRHGPVVGVVAVVLGAVVWSADVLGRAWLDGEFGRSFPDCDPCGVNGFAARLLVVSAIEITAFGPLAGIFGWLGTVARSRRPGIPPAPSSGNEGG